MHRLRLGDSLHIFLHEFIKHPFHTLGSWTLNFYLIAPLLHSNLPVAALIRHEQNVESVMVLSSNYRLRKKPYPYVHATARYHHSQILTRPRYSQIAYRDDPLHIDSGKEAIQQASEL